MLVDGNDVYRPSDRELLKGAIRQIAAQSGIGVIFAGLVDRSELTITEFYGTTTQGLKNLRVNPGEGVGGRALFQTRPVGVNDYLNQTGSPISTMRPCASKDCTLWSPSPLSSTVAREASSMRQRENAPPSASA